ncbi:GNAT family N-acetyltransferase [Apibacter raozihei]|uniref:GNAT family N-acetyltransferase n=1 Tax=Apibacter TaxID=1778601 RepID=UPI000FE2AD24|nr:MULTISPECIES: GNAT family N-acetyltransferase [Apibacter]
MSIRKATVNDEPAIRELLKQLDYPVSKGFLSDKIKILINNEDAELLVYEKESSVVAFISLHFIPQLAREGDYLRISYFAVEQKIRSNGIGREIEEYCTQLAKEKKCDRIELHTQSRRLLAQKFYTRQGYKEDPKYLIKKL